MLNIKVEQAYFMDHVKALGVLKVDWNENGSIQLIQRDTTCIFRFDQVEALWDTWLKAKNTGIVLCENDIESAIAVEGTAVKRILSHIEMTIIQKALIYSKGNQRLAADQIGMSRTKLGYRVRGIRSNTSVRAAA
ncbi:helix-turn-helix domain-containing protein [Acinetobacter sp. ANC 3926]|uniref:helix-turn-helix domain-containing protein n=1 Tax=Acinetobacter genomosp. 15BJ TaxID=106651 RepID=UPI001F4A7A70|nr:helix-turn-helix domain-containing protein [Acinetobacter genomosp. 15BJ]MCH7290977.1 helix-turn-helix domain-containing protein [Acinetobacter genomosp. 15BJ]